MMAALGSALPPPTPLDGAAPPPAATPTVRWSPTTSVARGAMALISTQPLTWAATFLATVFVPRLLGADGLGQYSVALTLSGIVGMAASLGVPEYLRRRVATNPESAQRDSGAALTLLALVAAVMALALGAAAPLMSGLLPDPRLVHIVLAGMIVSAVQNVVFSFLVGQERHGAFAWFNAAGVVLSALMGVGALALGASVIGYAFAMALAYTLVLALSWRASGLRLSRDATRLAGWRHLATGGLPFLGWNLAIRIRNQIDVAMVSALLTPQAAGWLAGAYRVIYIPSFVPNLLATPLLPALARCAREGTPAELAAALRRSVAAVLVLTVPMSALTAALAQDLPGVLGWGPEFGPAASLITILAIAQPLAGVDIILGTTLFALGRERAWMAVGIFAAVYNPALNLLAIPLFQRWTGHGALGATLVELSTELLMFVGAAFLLPRGLLNRALLATGARVVLAGLLAGFTAYALRPQSFLLAGASGGLVYVVASIAFGTLRIQRLWQSSGSLRERVLALAA